MLELSVLHRAAKQGAWKQLTANAVRVNALVVTSSDRAAKKQVSAILIIDFFEMVIFR
jgi:hypothetical protein